jgi:hypothetical protein
MSDLNGRRTIQRTVVGLFCLTQNYTLSRMYNLIDSFVNVGIISFMKGGGPRLLGSLGHVIEHSVSSNAPSRQPSLAPLSFRPRWRTWRHRYIISVSR